ncbi:unnamed protein product [Sphagnum tenellum]
MDHHLTFPVPQRMLDSQSKHFKPGLGEFQPGGKYIRMSDRFDITGQTVEHASIDVTDGKAAFYVSDGLKDPSTSTNGSIIKVNLIKATVGWKWLTKPDSTDTQTLCSVTCKQQHHYALRVEFDNGVTLARYANARSEPRLRPTTHGSLEFGTVIGQIQLRGHMHAVFDLIGIAYTPIEKRRKSNLSR